MSEPITPIIYYFGDDKIFFSGLKGLLDINKIKLKKFFATQEASIQSLFGEVAREEEPDAVLIDLSLHGDDYLHLARILSRTPFKKDIKMIGVLDHLKTDQTLMEALSTGLSLCFIKSDNMKDIGETLLKLVYPAKVSSSNYVKIKLDEVWTAGVGCKVGHISEEGLHFETNIPLEVGETIQVEHFWRNKTLIPSKEVSVKNIEDKSLVYHFNYAVDGQFVFIDSADNAQEPAEEVKRYNLIDEAKYRFKRIFLKNDSISEEKIVKVLLVDSEFFIYKDSKRSDRFPYLIRCLGSEKNIQNELKKFNPQIIAFSLNDVITQDTVKLVKDWCSANGVNPYFIIFKSIFAVNQWQEILSYQSVLASAEEIDTDVLVRIAKVLESKIKNTDGKQSKKIFVSKYKEQSNCEIELRIGLNLFSESEIHFTSKKRIPLHTNLRIREPVKTFAHVISEKEEKGIYYYQGILHSNDDLEKNFIRRYINTVFFRENEVKVQDKRDLVNPDEKLKALLEKSYFKSED